VNADSTAGERRIHQTTPPHDWTQTSGHSAVLRSRWPTLDNQPTLGRTCNESHHCVRSGAGAASLALTELPRPEAATNDVVVRVHAASFIHTELTGRTPGPNRAGRDRTPSVPGHDLSGVVVELGYGTTGLSVGQRRVRFIDWSRNGSLAEVHRGGSPQPRTAANRHRPHRGGRTADFRADRLARLIRSRPPHQWTNGLIHGVGGAVGSTAVQLAREVGARVIGTGRTADRDGALALGVHTFVDLDTEKLGRRRGSRPGVRRDRRRHLGTARPRWCAPVERSSPSPNRLRPGPATGGLSSSLSNPIAPSSLPLAARVRRWTPHTRGGRGAATRRSPSTLLPASASLARRSCA